MMILKIFKKLQKSPLSDAKMWLIIKNIWEGFEKSGSTENASYIMCRKTNYSKYFSKKDWNINQGKGREIHEKSSKS